MRYLESKIDGLKFLVHFDSPVSDVITEEDDAELLYLQGLIRCQDCDITYPNFLENCPQCKAKSI